MKSMGLQSPGRLATLSHNSSTNTLKQSTGAIKEASQSPKAKIFLINPTNMNNQNDNDNDIDKVDHNVVQSRDSPCFGSETGAIINIAVNGGSGSGTMVSASLNTLTATKGSNIMHKMDDGCTGATRLE